MMELIQWNINGFFKHLPELQQIIANLNPQIISLQETHFKQQHQISTLKNYAIYRKDRLDGNQAWGGVALFVKDSIYSQEIPLITNMEAIAVKIYNPHILTICSIYIPPNAVFSQQELVQLLEQLPKPFIITGDFNGHNSVWGSERTDNRGRLLENIFTDEVILNTGSPTYFNAGTGTFTHIDLSICDARIAPNIHWETLPDLFGSNHFPIRIEYVSADVQTNTTNLLPAKWDFENADWELFMQILSNVTWNINESEDINEILTLFVDGITDAAHRAIRLKKMNVRSKRTPWWNRDCEKANKENKKALNQYKRHRTTEHLINLKRTRAIARKVFKNSKKLSWQTYLSSINKDTPLKQVWEKIRRIKGITKNTETHTLVTNNRIVTNLQEISEIIADIYEENSSDKNYDEEFQRKKEREESQDFNIEEDAENPINLPITMDELLVALQTLKPNKAAGSDNLPSEIIQHLPSNALDYLIKIYNRIWIKREFPNSWREVVIIPILKPNKNKYDPYSYRPIGLSNVLCKVLERIINNRLKWFLETNNIICKFQNGFRSKKSTNDNLIQIVNEIQTAFLDKQHFIAIFSI